METLQARYDSRNSFYGKAYVEEKQGVIYLYSYTLKVCTLSPSQGVKLWYIGDHSQTTRRHVREFIKQYGTGADLETVNKIYASTRVPQMW